MTRIVLLFFIGLTSLLKGQVSIQNNMPQNIAPNTELSLEIKISKGGISNFAKYQMDVPAGIVIKEGNSRGGSFSFENNRLKIIWSAIPADAELVLTFKLLSGNVGGPAVISQRFYYMAEGARKEVDAEPLNVTFGGSDVKPKTDPAASQNATVSIQQAMQLKKDSKDAYETGIKEQEAAERKLAEADAALKEAESLNNETEKKAAIDKANHSKQKAENDKAVASKILMLAKSLDDNANEIERLNQDAGKAKDAPAAEPVAENGMVYRIQIGAFSQNPEKALSRHLGTIDIVQESGMYKVLMGKYISREDAARKREELVKRSFDCFIVTYKNGTRVKY